jgi:hypothetical protein
MSGWYWEDVSDLAGAEKAAHGGFWAAIFVAGVTTLVVLISLLGVRLLGINFWSLLDAGLFALIAFGIHQMSRFAAVAGTSLFIFERVAMFNKTGPGALVMGILILLLFVNSVRGTFAYHRLKPTDLPKPLPPLP